MENDDIRLVEIDSPIGISVAEACEYLTKKTKNGIVEKMSPTMLQAGLKQGAFPFGVGYKGTGNTYYYYIHKKLFIEFLKGNLPFGTFGRAIFGK